MMNFLFTKTPLVFLIQPIWRDEAFSYLLANKNFFEIFSLTAKDFNPPLYYLILHFWIKIFGSSEIAIRSLSIIFYWAAVYIGFLFLTDILKIKLKKAFLYTFLIAINPLLLYYAFEARMYSMLAFFSALSFYSLYKKNKNLYFISSILGLYTHNFMIIAIVVQFLMIKLKQRIVFLSYLPWIIFVLINKGLSIESFWIKKQKIQSLINFISQIYTGYELEFKFYDKSLIILSVGLFSIITIGYLKFNNKLFKYLLSWGVGIPFLIVLISFIKPIFLPRYLIFCSIGLILLLIFIIEKLPKLFEYLILILLISATLNYNQLQIKTRRKSNLKKSVLEIKYLMKKNDLIYVTSELDYFTVQYYLGKNYLNQLYIWGKTYEEIPNYVGKALISKEKITNSLPSYPNKAFILQSNGQYSIQAMY